MPSATGGAAIRCSLADQAAEPYSAVRLTRRVDRWLVATHRLICAYLRSFATDFRIRA
jgi:hypothetical protein